MVSIERETFPELIAAGRALYAYTTTTIGSTSAARSTICARIATCSTACAASRRWPIPMCIAAASGMSATPGSRPGSKAAVFLADDAVIEPGARVGPYAVLGERVRVATEASVAVSVVWTGAVIEPRATVIGSVLADNVRIGSGAYVHDGTVVGHDAEIPAETSVPPHSRIVAEAAVAPT